MTDRLSSLILDKSFLRREQTQLLCESIPRGSAFSVLLASVLCLFIFQNTTLALILTWLSIILLSLIIRALFYKKYLHSTNKREHTDKWYIAFLTLCSSTMAFAWGLAGILFYPNLDSLGQIAVLITMVAYSASSMPALSVRTNTYSLHLILVYCPMVSYLIIAGNAGEKLLAILLIIIASTTMVAGRRFYNLLVSNMFYQAETQRLLDDLQKTNSRLSMANESLQQLSITDDLTNLANRRYFNQRFTEIWSDHNRENVSLSALMIDVDFFKSYNDTYGHPAGDQCLRQIADALRATLFRPRDFLARYGGEEFIIILPNTNAQGANEIAARMHVQIKKLNIEHAPKGIDHRLTISIGITSMLPPTKLTRADFIQTVDKALYHAKENGRNQSSYLPS